MPEPEGDLACWWLTDLMQLPDLIGDHHEDQDRQPRSTSAEARPPGRKWTRLSLCVSTAAGPRVGHLQRPAGGSPRQSGPLLPSLPFLEACPEGAVQPLAQSPPRITAPPPAPALHPETHTPQARSRPPQVTSGGSSSTGAWCGAVGDGDEDWGKQSWRQCRASHGPGCPGGTPGPPWLQGTSL